MSRMRVVAHLLVFVVVFFALFVGLGISFAGIAVWGDVLWIVAAETGMINLVWTVRYMMKH